MNDLPVSHSELDEIFNGLSTHIEAHERARSQINLWIAEDFTVFRYINVNEQLLSKMIANLLDPKGSHGQGDVFLRSFLRMIQCDAFYQPGDVVNVQVEVLTKHSRRTQRRIDVLIDIAHEYGIAIENKPWAGDQFEQISDYLEHLENVYAQNHYRLIYLAGQGKKPSEDSLGTNSAEQLIKENKLLLMFFRGNEDVAGNTRQFSLYDWLLACHQLCKADKVRWFLHDFMAFVEQAFGYETDTDNGIPEVVE